MERAGRLGEPQDRSDPVILPKDGSRDLGVSMLHIVGKECGEQAEKESDRGEEWACDADPGFAVTGHIWTLTVG